MYFIPHQFHVNIVMVFFSSPDPAKPLPQPGTGAAEDHYWSLVSMETLLEIPEGSQARGNLNLNICI